MTLVDRIKEDLKLALKAGDNKKVGVLRLALSEANNRAKVKQGQGYEPVLTDEETVEVLRKELKRRKDAMELFLKGGRRDLAEKEEFEIDVMKNYLPQEATSEEIEAAVKKVIADGQKDFGSAMREAMKILKGRADGKIVGEAVKKLL